MSELVEFLRARLDEDERIARAAGGDGHWTAEDIAVYGERLDPTGRVHMATHDPARVLAEVEAKRGLLDGYVQAAEEVKTLGRDEVIPGYYTGRKAALEAAITILAAVYGWEPELLY
jgi:hypothetical protein